MIELIGFYKFFPRVRARVIKFHEIENIIGDATAETVNCFVSGVVAHTWATVLVLWIQAAKQPPWID